MHLNVFFQYKNSHNDNTLQLLTISNQPTRSHFNKDLKNRHGLLLIFGLVYILTFVAGFLYFLVHNCGKNEKMFKQLNSYSIYNEIFEFVQYFA